MTTSRDRNLELDRRQEAHPLGHPDSLAPEALPTDGVVPLMVETLEQGLSRLRGYAVRIRDLERDPSSRSSSFRTERLRAFTDDDAEPLKIYFKDLNPAHQVTQS